MANYSESVESLAVQVGEDSYACAVCGAVDTVEHDEHPSMAGYGHDSSLICSACGASQTDNPITGWSRVTVKGA
jgi:hypothetical protein